MYSFTSAKQINMTKIIISGTLLKDILFLSTLLCDYATHVYTHTNGREVHLMFRTTQLAKDAIAETDIYLSLKKLSHVCDYSPFTLGLKSATAIMHEI